MRSVVFLPQPGLVRRGRPLRRGGLLAAAAVLHGAALWLLLHHGPRRDSPLPELPLWVHVIADARAPQPPAPLPLPVATRRPPPVALAPPDVVVGHTPAPLPPAAPADAVPTRRDEAPALAAVAVHPRPAGPPAPASAVAATIASATLPAPLPVAPPARPSPPTLEVSAVAYRTPPVLHYPLASRRAQEQGQVLVRVLVDASGLPERTELLRSSGHPRLDEAALAAVRATRFRPHAENGIARPFWVVMPLVFELDT